MKRGTIWGAVAATAVCLVVGPRLPALMRSLRDAGYEERFAFWRGAPVLDNTTLPLVLVGLMVIVTVAVAAPRLRRRARRRNDPVAAAERMARRGTGEEEIARRTGVAIDAIRQIVRSVPEAASGFPARRDRGLRERLGPMSWEPTGRQGDDRSLDAVAGAVRLLQRTGTDRTIEEG
ncbi:MAG: hypothetical protein GF346_08405 [Candidatus Eisenbacteria bacterium]|nr:hypothetical protein [Candidatus Latescibacterota bacterium]MBD3302455.1 hypothetical protein [Candidatus Eisenbacteria bacterium]